MYTELLQPNEKTNNPVEKQAKSTNNQLREK